MPENRPKAGGRTANRTSFKPGQSGNPGGRKKDTEDVKQAKEELRKLALPGVMRLKAALEDPDTKPAEVIKIVEIVLDRVYGRATQPIVADVHTEAEPVTLSQMLARAKELLGEEDG